MYELCELSRAVRRRTRGIFTRYYPLDPKHRSCSRQTPLLTEEYLDVPSVESPCLHGEARGQSEAS